MPRLHGIEPGSLVAFARASGWRQVPVQVDERALVDYRKVRQTTSFGAFSHEAYTDPGTYAGADPDPTLDEGDEIAMMAADAGARAEGAASPAGVDPGTRTEVRVHDPLQPGTARYLYLYETDSGLDPAAGERYVDYEFDLDSGDYKSTYDFTGVADNGSGPPANTEGSSVTTDFYSQSLLSRWVADELRITAGSAGGIDILDGDKVQVSYGCGRSELTFSRGGGGFIVNKSGPVRAIRSYIGANSGTFTQRDHVYYERRDDMTTYLRVHPGITTISSFLDFSPAASGMSYRNSANPAGVTIDGVPDPGLDSGGGAPIEWEQATGPQGTVSSVSRVETDLPGFAPGSYFLDDSTSPSVAQCGGYADNQAWGSSGPVFTSGGANTDPTLGSAYSLTGTRSAYYSEPGGSAGLATLRSEQTDTPLVATARSQREPSRKPAFRLRATGPKRKIAPGRSLRLRTRVSNSGEQAIGSLRLCPKTKRRVVAIDSCLTLRGIAPGETVRRRFGATLRRASAGRDSVRVRFVATVGKAHERDTLRLRPRG